MVEDTDKHIIKLTKDVGELTGTLKALVSAVDGGFKQTREAQAQDMEEMRKVNSDQWDIIEKNRSDSAVKDSAIIKDCSDHRLRQSRSSIISGGGTGGVVFVILKTLEWIFSKGQWIGS